MLTKLEIFCDNALFSSGCSGNDALFSPGEVTSISPLSATTPRSLSSHFLSRSRFHASNVFFFGGIYLNVGIKIIS